MRLVLPALIAVACAALVGCYESSDVAIHSAGDYKGKPDSRTVLNPSQEQQEALVKRFHTGQTDQ